MSGDEGQDRDRRTGRLGRRNRPTRKQGIFAAALADGATKTVAARQAGYYAPAVAGCRLTKSPIVQEQIKRELQAQLDDLVPLAVARCEGVLKGEGRPMGPTEWQICQFLFRRRGLEDERQEKDSDIKTIGSMTLEELLEAQRAIVKAQKAEIEPKDVTADVQLIEDKGKDTA